jgi:hypothetical protein
MDIVQDAIVHIGQTISRQRPKAPAPSRQPEPISVIIDRLNARLAANAARVAGR